MKTTIATGCLIALSIAAPAMAANDAPSKEENIGVGTGVVVGALAGGPIGAIIGAAFGAKLGESIHTRNEKADALSAELDARRLSVDKLEKELTTLQARNRALDDDLDQLRSMARPELTALLQAGIEMDLLFRTDEHVLAGDTNERLETLAGRIAAMDDVNVRVDGYSDERGDEAYNRTLSEKRAAYVRDVLVAAGVPENRIKASGHGETPATQPNADSYALERKVSLTLFVPRAQSLASNPASH